MTMEATMAEQKRGEAVGFAELRPGDQVEVEHLVTVGPKQWKTSVAGKVVRTQRRRHGLHFDRNADDHVFSDTVVLERPDGELVSLALDEYSEVRRVEAAPVDSGS